MKRIAALLVTVSLWTGSASAEPSQVIANLRAGREQVIVCYGTSLTEKGDWVRQLQEWLDGAGFAGKASVLNKGVSGSTSASHGIKNVQRDVVEQNPHAVLIEFGMNDCIQRLADPAANPPRLVDAPIAVPLEKFRENLRQMIATVRNALPGTEIFLLTMNPAFDSPQTPNSGRFRAELSRFYDAVREIGVQEKVPVIDTNKAWLALEAQDPQRVRDLIPDGVHPGAEAGRVITFPAVRSALLGE